MTVSTRWLTPVLLAALIVASGTVSAQKVSGVEIPDTLSVGSDELVLNGAGIRKKLFIKLYVGSLYLLEKSTDADAIMSDDTAMAISMHIKSDLLTKKKLLGALKEGMEKSTNGNTAPIQAEIDQLTGLFKDSVKPGDVITLAYEPGTGTHVIINGETLDSIAGLPFKQALFGIWISGKPAQASLKKAMLGS